MAPTRSPTSPSSGRAAPSSSSDAARTAAASASPSLTSLRSVLWAMPAPQSLTATGKPILPAAAPASSADCTSSSAGTGTPCRPSNAFDSASDSVGTTRSAPPLDVGLDGGAGVVEPAFGPGVPQHAGEFVVPAVGDATLG